MKRIVIATLFGFTLCSSVSAYAGGATETPPSLPGALFAGVIQERDVTLLFDYMREALGSAIAGRDVRPPEELTQRAEAIGDELKRRGAVAARAAIDAIEQSIRESLREQPSRLPPPTSSQQRL